MDLTFQVPMQYCSLQHSDLASITSHIHNWALFLLWLCLFILSGVSSPLFSSSILGTYRPGNFIFQCHIFLSFYTVNGVLKQEYWSGLPFLSPVDQFCQNSPPWPVRLGWPYTARLSFIELDKAVVHVIRLVSCLGLWFQSICLLMPSLSAYYLTWFSLTLDVGYLFTAVPAKRSRCSLPSTWKRRLKKLA